MSAQQDKANDKPTSQASNRSKTQDDDNKSSSRQSKASKNPSERSKASSQMSQAPSQRSQAPSQRSQAPSQRSEAPSQRSEAPSQRSRVPSQKSKQEEEDPWREDPTPPPPSVTQSDKPATAPSRRSSQQSTRPSQTSQRSEVIPEEEEESEEEDEESEESSEHRSQYDLYYGARGYSVGGSSGHGDWSPRAMVEDKIGGCTCYPATSTEGVPSMVYDKITCEHIDVPGLTHKKVFKFFSNWVKPGRLPPIHKAEYVQNRKNGGKTHNAYTYMQGYPPMKYGLNIPNAHVIERDEEVEEDEDDDDEEDKEEESQASSPDEPRTRSKGTAQSQRSQRTQSRTSLQEPKPATAPKDESEDLPVPQIGRPTTVRFQTPEPQTPRPVETRASRPSGSQQYTRHGTRHTQRDTQRDTRGGTRDTGGSVTREGMTRGSGLTRASRYTRHTSRAPTLPPIQSRSSYHSSVNWEAEDGLRAVEVEERDFSEAEFAPVNIVEIVNRVPTADEHKYKKNRLKDKVYTGKMYDPATKKTMTYTVDGFEDRDRSQKQYL